MTQSVGSAPVPARMCVRCERITDVPVLVQEVHGGTGPGWNGYACPVCAPQVPRAPDMLAVLDATVSLRGSGDER